MKYNQSNRTKMKKYIIRYKDGSIQHAMKAEYSSRKEAGETLMDYICDHNEDLDIDDDDYLSPFDFTLEEVECNEVNEHITDFDSARKNLGIKPNTDFYVVKRKYSEKVVNLEDVARLVTDINPKHLEALIALNELFTIAEAWNKEDGFVPDFSDGDQYKWYPSFIYDKHIARYTYYRSPHAIKHTTSSSGTRLCFKTPERAEQFGKQFEDLYNKVFL